MEKDGWISEQVYFSYTLWEFSVHEDSYTKDNSDCCFPIE